MLQGRLRLWETATPQPPRGDTLWVFPPGHRHGWSGVPGRACRVFVLHTEWVPSELIQLSDRGLALDAALSSRDRDRLRGIATRIRGFGDRPTLRQRLAARHAVLELSLLALEQHPQVPAAETVEAAAARRVDQAVTHYEQHLADGPRVAQVAEALGMSATHLRRLFLKVRRQTPHAAFNQVRFERADELLVQTRLPIAEVARLLGFSGAEAFHRAYRQSRGHPPGRIRRSNSD